MTQRRVMIALLAAAVLALPLAGTARAQAKEMFIPSLVYRTGPYAPSGIPFANGLWDYLREDWFYSHRRAADPQRMLAVVGLRDNS
jgi:hypothetical protein